MGFILMAGLYCVLAVWVIGIVIAFRRKITCMAGMMAAMTLGMTIGLGTGTLLAIWLPGQFFHSTMIAILIGAGIGALTGTPISLMAVIDGLLSGLMGGMMGTMLMVMIPAPYAIVTVKILSLLCSGILFILFLMLKGENVFKEKTTKLSLFLKPGIMFIVIGITLGITVLDSTKHMLHEANPTRFTESSEHDHRGPAVLPEVQQEESPEVIVRATEFTFTPSSIRIKAGQTIKLFLENKGEVEHDYEIVGTNIHIHTAPGEVNAKLITLNKPGYYQVVCTLPGHRAAGMTGSIQVTV